MILKNGKIYSEGLLRKGDILINNDIIAEINFSQEHIKLKKFVKKNQDGKEVDCENKLILPGIIDIHSHLRDMGQSEKETFLTGTKAAAFSGITTVFNMPNTIPPAITSDQIKMWMKKAEANIHVDVGFIAGVPKELNKDEIKLIVDLGVIGFKIYPLNSINDIDWKEPKNLQKILEISSKFQIPIFIHASFPKSNEQIEQNKQELELNKGNILVYHDCSDTVSAEDKYVKLVIENYIEFIDDNNLSPVSYPKIHFCHVSCIESYLTIKRAQNLNKEFKISFEVTPHHLLLSNTVNLSNENFGKVLPPLRGEEHHKFLFNELMEGNINLLGTDHAPHTIEEKSQKYFEAPSGFPGFETSPLLILGKVFNFQLSLERFVEVASENPVKIFHLRNKGFIKEGYDADLLIVDKVNDYQIEPQNFITKAKFSPFEQFKTNVKIWKVFLRGIEINIKDSKPTGKIIKKIL
jgi:dihydroorotase